MNSNEKAKRVGIVFIALLIIGGLALMYTGNDAIVQGASKKEGILTAEQVKMSFDSVSGRLIKEAVKEGDVVKQGDVIMELDSTDTDLAIEKVKACLGVPEAVSRTMVSCFTHEANITRLKAAVDGRIQEKESVRKNSEKKGEAKVNISKKL
jgi:multidrug resistance efflux pump